jgi:hypothetical protein
MVAFTLLNLQSGETIERTYEDGKRAAKIAMRLTALTKRKYQVRKVEEEAGDPNWRDRERARFASGEYIPLHSCLKDIAITDTFPHVAKKDPGLVAYTKDEQRGRLDKQSVLSVRAYVEMCLNHPEFLQKCGVWAKQMYGNDRFITAEMYRAESFTPAWVEHVIAAHMREVMEKTSPVLIAGPLPENFTDEDVKRVGDLIEEVYTNYSPNHNAVANSCMRYDASQYRARVDGKIVHPVRAYTSPDLALAYTVDSAGKTTARAVVWPAKKIYSRLYANSDALARALQAQGYARAGYYENSSGRTFKDARMRRIETDCGNYLMPYLDNQNKYFDDDGEWLRMEGDDYCGEVTGGVAESDACGRATCDHCGARANEDDMRVVYTNDRRTASEMWCEHCVDSDATYCHGTEEYYDGEEVALTEVDGEWYTERYAEQHAHYCEYYDRTTFEEVTDVIVNDDGDTQCWSYSARWSNAIDYDGEWYSKDLTFVDVVTSRYNLHRHMNWATYTWTVAWYADFTEKVPLLLIEQGDVDAYLGEDGCYYMRDYPDLHPMRERVREQGAVWESWVTTAYAAHIEQWEQDEIKRRIDEEREAARLAALPPRDENGRFRRKEDAFTIDEYNNIPVVVELRAAE